MGTMHIFLDRTHHDKAAAKLAQPLILGVTLLAAGQALVIDGRFDLEFRIHFGNMLQQVLMKIRTKSL